MATKIMLLVPEAPGRASSTEATQRKLSKKGVRLGVLNNGKGNADHLLNFLVEGLKAEVPIASVAFMRKHRSAHAAPREILDQLADEADCVISAMAD